MTKSKYTTEQVEFVRELSPTHTRKQIFAEHKTRFGEELTFGRLTYLRRLAGVDCNFLNKPFGHNWSEDEKQWLRDNVAGITTHELRAKFNEHFGLELTYEQVKNQKKHLRLSNGLDCRFQKGMKGYPRGVGYQHYFTKEQLEFIQENVWNSNIDLAQLFNEKYGTDLTPRQMYGAKHRHGITGAPVGCHATRFYSGYMKGRVSPNAEPIGAMKTWGKKNPAAKCKKNATEWDSPGRVTWEAAHGPVPDGYIIRYLDGNPFNNALENLECISRAENAVINMTATWGTDAGLNKASVTVAKIVVAAKYKSKQTGGKK